MINDNKEPSPHELVRADHRVGHGGAAPDEHEVRALLIHPTRPVRDNIVRVLTRAETDALPGSQLLQRVGEGVRRGLSDCSHDLIVVRKKRR